MDELPYKNLAQLLISRIGERHYFNGTVSCDIEEKILTLKTSLIIYRQPLAGPDSRLSANRITDIVPVWWEFKQTDSEGNISDEFSWSEFRPFLLCAL